MGSLSLKPPSAPPFISPMRIIVRRENQNAFAVKLLRDFGEHGITRPHQISHGAVIRTGHTKLSIQFVLIHFYHSIQLFHHFHARSLQFIKYEKILETRAPIFGSVVEDNGEKILFTPVDATGRKNTDTNQSINRTNNRPNNRSIDHTSW